MGSLDRTWLRSLWRLAIDVLTGAAACSLALAATDIIDVRYALLTAAVLAGIGLLLEEPRPA
jgi:hypothetical protein